MSTEMPPAVEKLWLKQQLEKDMKQRRAIKRRMMEYNKADVVLSVSVNKLEKLKEDARENGPTIQEEF